MTTILYETNNKNNLEIGYDGEHKITVNGIFDTEKKDVVSSVLFSVEKVMHDSEMVIDLKKLKYMNSLGFKLLSDLSIFCRKNKIDLKILISGNILWQKVSVKSLEMIFDNVKIIEE